MKHITKLKLAAVHQYCDIEDKSTEFMYQFMQDSVKVDLDTVNNYFFLKDEERIRLRKEVNEFLEFFDIFEFTTPNTSDIETPNIETFECYEIHRPNMPNNSCTKQCKECKEKQDKLL